MRRQRYSGCYGQEHWYWSQAGLYSGLLSQMFKFTARLIRSQQMHTELCYVCGCFGNCLCLELGGALSGAWWMSTYKLAVNWHSPAALIRNPQGGDFLHVNTAQYGTIPYTQNIKHGNKKHSNKALQDPSLHQYQKLTTFHSFISIEFYVSDPK